MSAHLIDCLATGCVDPMLGTPVRKAQWFTLYTTPRHEKHVSELLKVRAIETFLPLYRMTRQ